MWRSYGIGVVREAVDGMTASARKVRYVLILSASYALSAMTCLAGKPSIRASACVLSWTWPAVRRRRIGLQSASTEMWILVLSPPRERPSA